jgi:hypothetical protein
LICLALLLLDLSLSEKPPVSVRDVGDGAKPGLYAVARVAV